MKKFSKKTTSILLSIIGVIMAIVIPSKYIYDIVNPKVRNNYIDKVETNQTIVTPNNEYEKVVYTETFKNNLFNDTDQSSSKIEYNWNSYGGLVEAYAYISASQSWGNISVRINKTQENSFISKVFTGVRTVEQGETTNETSWIGSSVKYEKTTAQASLPVTNASYNALSGLVSYTVGELFVGDKTIEQKTNETLPLAKTSSVCEVATQSGYTIASASITLPNRNTILTPEIKEEEDYYIFNITLLTKSISIPLELAKPGKLEQSATFTMTGTYEEYAATEVTLTFYGNTIGISLEDGTVTIGNGNQPFSLNGNELMQDSATTNNILTTDFLGNNILSQYKNGKETATLLCAIGEYYNEDGTLAISTKNNGLPMTFDIGNEAIPMVYKIPKGGTKPIDTPMSLYSSGNAKVFTIVSVEPIYDGAVWQRLTLLEKTE